MPASDEHPEHDDPAPDDEELEELPPIDIDNPEIIETARRRYGSGGAALAAGMFGLDQLLTGKQKPEFAEVQESPTEPVDLDKDGFQFALDEATSVAAPPLERRAPLGVRKKKSRRR